MTMKYGEIRHLTIQALDLHPEWRINEQLRENKIEAYDVISINRLNPATLEIFYWYDVTNHVRYEKMTNALWKAAQQFRQYARNHRAKNPPQEDKAQVNEDMALMCDEALSDRVPNNERLS